MGRVFDVPLRTADRRWVERIEPFVAEYERSAASGADTDGTLGRQRDRCSKAESSDAGRPETNCPTRVRNRDAVSHAPGVAGNEPAWPPLTRQRITNLVML